MPSIADIIPTKKTRVIDLVTSLGIDTTSWGEFKGGQARAAANPKYCYEWNFDSNGNFVVVNFWTHQFTEQDGQIVWHRDLRDFTHTGNATQRARGNKLKSALRRAFDEKLIVRVIICHGDRRRDGKRSNVEARSLDLEPWVVSKFDEDSGYCKVVRGAVLDEIAIEQLAPTLSNIEGQEFVRWYSTHRRREWQLRDEKIKAALKSNGGRLRCEVPRCGFDFFAKYGDLGNNYIQVHHLEPISQYPTKGKYTRLVDLAIVCANCHVMIHRGGACRDTRNLIPEP